MLEINLIDHVSPFLTETEERIENLSPALTEIGDILIAGIRENIDTQNGGSWTERQQDEPWPTMHKSNTLYDSFYATIGDNEVSVNTDVEYAHYQDSMRPFMFIRDEDEQKIEDVLSQFLLP